MGMLDGLFSSSNYQVAKKLMDVSVLKNEAVARNIANSNTPGYRRVEVDSSFDHHLKRMLQSGDISDIDSLTPEIKVDSDAVSRRDDGNTVEIDKEMLDMNRNELEIQFLSQYLTGRFKSIKGAIKGSSGS
jgi:flagellar basal-body rod protein FlgB